MPVRHCLCVLALLATAACSTGAHTPPSTEGTLSVVAAEDVWGSLAAQLGGDRVDVTSIVSSPDADPHDYEPTAADGRAVASAGYVIANGIGYDPWIDKLVAANPSASRAVLDIGTLVGLHEGDNPHQWYSPDTVEKVIVRITADYKRLRPADAAYFDQQRAAFESTGVAAYRRAVSTIRAKHAGAPVGASESIVVPLVEALGLKLLTPLSFLDAVSEGNDPTAADKAAVDQQIATNAMKVLVFNSQNATPDVQRLVEAAKAKGIPVVTVTETLVPKGATFQDWQTTQLEALLAALDGAPR
jgi:zinc/manganese transport system substrate-binding protein